MRSFREDNGRFIQRISRISGLDMGSPIRTLAEGCSPYLMNVRVRTGHIEPCRNPGTVVSRTIETIYGSGMYRTTTPYLILLGTSRAYSTSGGSADLTDISPTPLFAWQAYPRWQCMTMMSLGVPTIVVNNGGYNRPHYTTSPLTSFQQIADAPRCKCIHNFTGQLFCGAVYDTDTTSWLLNRIVWSDEQDITSWNGVTTGYLDLEDEADPIQQLITVIGGNLGIFRAESIYIGVPNNDITNPLSVSKYFNRGLYAPHTLQYLEGNWAFVSAKDIFLLSVEGLSLTSIGEPIRHEFFDLVDPDQLEYAWSFVDQVAQEYYIVTALKDGTQRGWVFNYYDKTWTMQDMTGITVLISWYNAGTNDPEYTPPAP